MLIFSFLLTLPAFFSGEGAEEMIEDLPTISHRLIHEHGGIGRICIMAF